jgi:chromate transport protein ChrA
MAGLLAFALWWCVCPASQLCSVLAFSNRTPSLPGAIGMYGLSLGVSRIGDTLPVPAYALLFGLNAATVGIIALAAVQLADKAITDKLSRILVFLGGVAGMLYTALWYFPVLMLTAGLATLIWDLRLVQSLFKPFWRGHRTSMRDNRVLEQTPAPREINVALNRSEVNSENSLYHRSVTAISAYGVELPVIGANSGVSGESFNPVDDLESGRIVLSNIELKVISWKAGILIIAGFIGSFTTVMAVRTLLRSPPRGVSLFSNLYLVGTIIFGGGTVVIPLLREYIVAEGWVSPRDFLLGLALIQSFPGPNFNFAVYLGSLVTAESSLLSIGGALIVFLGVFAPGIITVTGVTGLWNIL